MPAKRGTDWFVRVHRTYEEIQPWIQNLESKCTKLVAYQHDADEEVNRTHCHLMIIGYTTTDETMKMQLKKVLGTRLEKTDWAWDPSVRSEADTIQYMSKKDLHPSFCKGYEDEFVAECSAKYLPKSEYAKSNSKTQFKIVSEKPAESKKRQNDLLDEMVAKIRNQYPMDKYVTNADMPFDHRLVLNIIIEVLNEHRVIFGRYKVRDYYDTILSRLWPFKFQDRMQTMIGFVTKDFAVI